MSKRTRIAVVVFADVSGEASDAEHVVEYWVRQRLGPLDGTEHPVPLRDASEVKVRVHNVTEVGVAAGNGYLWTEPTSKAYGMYEWQREEGD
jgi:hypothetical protein